MSAANNAAATVFSIHDASFLHRYNVPDAKPLTLQYVAGKYMAPRKEASVIKLIMEHYEDGPDRSPMTTNLSGERMLMAGRSR